MFFNYNSLITNLSLDHMYISVYEFLNTNLQELQPTKYSFY